MADRLTELLLKAVRALPPAEQDEVLGALLGGMVSGPASGAPFDGSAGVALTLDAPFAVDIGPTAVSRADRLLRVQPLGTLESLVGTPPGEAETALRVLPVRLPVTDYERLRAFSRQHGFSMAVIIRTLVERFLDGQARRWAPRGSDPDDDLDDDAPAGHA